MMKLLLYSLVVLIGAAALAVLIKDDPGYVLISAGPWTVETTLALLVFALALLFAALYFTIRFFVRLKGMPRSLGSWREHRKAEKAQKTLTHGLVELTEGQWRQAERHVLKYAGEGESPMLNYLAAARAAQEQGAADRRDRYLKLAQEAEPNADIAVGLTQAELLLNQGQKEQALASLRRLHQLMPAHPQVLKPLARLYREMGEWQNLVELLPKLRKRKVFDDRTLDEMAREAHTALLRSCKDVDSLLDAWSKLPKAMREEEEMLVVYLQRLLDLGEGAKGEPLLRTALKRRRSDALLRLYGLLEGPDPSRQLRQAESYLLGHEQDATALLTAGRLCLRNGLWGKARDYLEASVNARPSAEACAELAVLLDKMGEREKALRRYREALRLVPSCGPLVAAEVAMVEHTMPALEAPEVITPPDVASG